MKPDDQAQHDAILRALQELQVALGDKYAAVYSKADAFIRMNIEGSWRAVQRVAGSAVEVGT